MRCTAHRHQNRHVLHLAVCLLCLLLAMLHTASAAELERLPDPTQMTSLTIRYADDGSLPDGVTFRLYYVATISDEVQFVPAAPFDGYSIEFRNDMSSSEWATLADTLTSYVAADGLQANVSRQAVNGEACFTELRAGLYLVLGQDVDMNGEVYTPKSTLIVLPNRQSNGWWQYDVEMIPKWDIGAVEYKELQVIKVWDDNEADDRPLSVEVELYRDGVFYEVVTLSKDNNWRHTWTELDTRYAWTVVEHIVPEGYTVTITEEDGLVIIKNVRTYPPEGTDDPDLPQTGTDWVPVMILAGVGMVLFLAGWIRWRESEWEEV